MNRVIPLLLGCLITFSSSAKEGEPIAEPESFKESVRGGLETKGQIIGMQEMPISKLMFVEAEQGNYLISTDGRFVIEGTVKDVWHRRTLRTVDDVIATQRTPVSNIGFQPEAQLAHFIVGDPELPRQGVAFVDPTSAYTTQFLQMLNDKAQDVNWTVVLMPLVGGSAAVDRSLRLHCASDRDQALLDFIHGTSHSFNSMREGCSDEKVMLGMYLTELFRIQNLPHIIREDGLVSSGLPVDFDAWFNQP